MNETVSTPDSTAPLTTPDVGVKTVVRKPRKKELKNLTRREGIWYFHKLVNGKKEFNGRRTPFTLETGDLMVAKTRRDAILRAANGQEVDRVLGREHRHAAKLKDIFEAYRRSPMVRANAKTRERSLADLVRMISTVKGDTCNVEELSSTELTWRLVEDWQSHRLAAARAACGSDLVMLEGMKRSLNSLLTHVQAIFSKQALAAYRALYLPPNVAEFATALPVPARKQEDPVHFSDEFVLGLLRGAEELAKSDPGAWTAFQLMTWGGLRNNECFHARRNWVTKTLQGYRLEVKPEGDFMPKGNSRAVVLPAAVIEAMLERPEPVNLLTGERDTHLVPAMTMSDRHDACYRRLNDWLKAQGVAHEVGKVSYRLRKYFLAKVAVQQHPLLAQAAAGHASLVTTQEHYIGKPKMTVPITLGAKPEAAAG